MMDSRESCAENPFSSGPCARGPRLQDQGLPDQGSQGPASDDPYALARLNMVRGQLRPLPVRDEKLLGLMQTLPRELFVPPGQGALAYSDAALSLGRPTLGGTGGRTGRFLLPPLLLARMIEALALGSGDKVLDVGPASGYATALLAGLVGEVVAVESDTELADWATQRLAALQTQNAVVHRGPLPLGWRPSAPYDAILVEGAVEDLPPSLWEQLKEGGRLLALFAPEPAASLDGAAFYEGRLYEKRHGGLSSRFLFNASAPVLPGFARAARFVF